MTVVNSGRGRPAESADMASRRYAGSTAQLVSVSKSYAHVAAIDNVSLRVESGEFISLLGPSGSGKTTTLMTLAGFERPDVGQVLIGGKDMTGVPPNRRDIGMVFQSYALFPHMSVFDNVAYALHLRRLGKAEVQNRVRDILDVVQLPLDVYGDRNPRQLSGGQQQRVALARALVYEPKVLLMDEPMGALDKNLRAQLQLELRRLHDRLKLTIVYVTHDQEEALLLSDRIAVMNHGRIEQLDSPAGLYEGPTNEFVARFIGDANVIDATVAGRNRVAVGRSGMTMPVHITAESGSQLKLMIRPEDVHLVSVGEGQLTGTVTSLLYLGGVRRVELETPVGILTARMLGGKGSALSVGSHVGIEIPDASVVLLPKESDDHGSITPEGPAALA